MATVVYKNAKILINDSLLSTSFSELAVEYSAEMLDETSFGDDTRTRKGGLKIGKMTGKGYFEAGVQLDRVIFDNVGVDDTILTVFADGITPGTVTDMGFAMKGVLSEFKVGESVGGLLAFDMACEGRGIN